MTALPDRAAVLEAIVASDDGLDNRAADRITDAVMALLPSPEDTETEVEWRVATVDGGSIICTSEAHARRTAFVENDRIQKRQCAPWEDA